MLETVWESRWLPDYYGGIAQLGEHLPCKQGVKGSNPFISTEEEILEVIKLKGRNLQKKTLIQRWAYSSAG